MKKFAGYSGEQLHKGIGGSDVYINYSTWESVEQIAAGFGSQESQACVAAHPDEVTLARQLLEKIASKEFAKGNRADDESNSHSRIRRRGFREIGRN